MQTFAQSLAACVASLSATFGVLPSVAAQSIPDVHVEKRAGALRELDSLVALPKRDLPARTRIATLGPEALRHTNRQSVLSEQDVRRRGAVDSVLTDLYADSSDSARLALVYANWLFDSGVRYVDKAARILERVVDRAPLAHDSAVVAQAADRLGLLTWRRYEIVAHRRMSTMDPELSIGRFLEFPHEYPKFRELYSQPMKPPLGEAELALAAQRFARALQLNPRDSSAFRHVAMVAVEREDWDALERLARGALPKSPSDPWRSLTLGLALHRQGRAREAEQAFEAGFALMPRDVATRLQRVTRVMKPVDTLALFSVSASDRARIERSFWEVANPDAFGGGNVLRSEFRARLVHSQLRWSNEETYRDGVDSDRGEVFIRWGPPTEVANYKDRDAAHAVHIWWYESYRLHFLFRAMPVYGTAITHPTYRSWVVEALERESPGSWRNLVEVRSSVGKVDAAVVRFRWRDGIDRALVMPTLPLGLLSAAGMTDAARLRVRVAALDSMWRALEIDSATFTEAAPSDTTATLVAVRDLPIVRAAETLRIDVMDDATGRTAYGFTPVSPLRATGFELSDIAIARSIAVNDRPSAVVNTIPVRVTPLPAQRLTRGDPLALYFEVYEPATIDARQRLRVEIDVARVDAKGLVPTAIRMLGDIRGRLGGNSGRDALRMTYDVERAPASVHRESLQLSLGDAPTGRYRLRVRVTDLHGDSTQTIERTAAEFTLVNRR